MEEPKKILSVANELMINNDSVAKVDKDDKPKTVCQVNLTPVRCGSCNALLAKATTGSVMGIVCHRCKSDNFIEVAK